MCFCASLWLNLGLAMREHSQQAVDAEMKQHVRDYRNDNRQHQRVSAISLRTRDNSTKRRIKRIADRDHKPHKTCAASSRHQRQQKSHREQRVDYVENVINDL